MTETKMNARPPAASPALQGAAPRRAALLGLLAIAACAPLSSQPVPVVFFTQAGTTIDENGMVVIEQAAALARRWPLARVRVMGFAVDRANVPDEPLIRLAEERATAVAAALRQAGVSPGRLVVEPRGPVPFEQAPLESRRVEIRIGDM
ncbi:OmpA family protein [Roseomonas sp. NAR14]|uniref:OmpA family protein n=1 Tax=Roseomonas acroporae TaxID=2937791 RepID=A0A9X1Y526_9PROT|nr:OmpA family protein [Roseomonas acroporae]MCK8783262.1 OmpA family protein [Roseomonas acroporae]